MGIFVYACAAPLALARIACLHACVLMDLTGAVLEPRHTRAAAMAKTIDLVQTFRTYLHYHIKCSKAYLHSRMRNRTAALIKVLNRARPGTAVKKKTRTAGGRTFVRK